MLFGTDRRQLRGAFCETWRKHCAGQSLEPLERLIAAVIAQHPEYHRLLSDNERVLEQDFTPEHSAANPFLHMGLHIAIQEQLRADRPLGIMEIYRQYCQRLDDPHLAEHQIMEVLGEVLWDAQRRGTPPDETLYLHKLKARLRQH
ncbi:MAG: DUF1841 family protein [Gammaproteobacteria bacterium]